MDRQHKIFGHTIESKGVVTAISLLAGAAIATLITLEYGAIRTFIAGNTGTTVQTISINPPECSDRSDQHNDGLIDMEDPCCKAPGATSTTKECGSSATNAGGVPTKSAVL